MLSLSHSGGSVDTEHVPVLLSEVMSGLGDLRGRLVVDATYGRGGYSVGFLEGGADVIAVDRDPDAVLAGAVLESAYGGRFRIMEGRFGDLSALLGGLRADAIVFDLGVSTPQLLTSDRGFSFSRCGRLDMRMERSGVSAEDIINDWSQDELKRIFRDYGELSHAGRVAGAIVRRRVEGRIEWTTELAGLVEGVIGRRGGSKIHPATLVFQALRIAVNDELEQLREALSVAPNLLKRQGKLAVVSFHSLEDRLVKKAFRDLCGRGNPSRHAPPRLSDGRAESPSFRLLTGKAITPTSEAVRMNRRARSAKLRILQKLTDF